MNKVNVKEIIIMRAEGETRLCGIKNKFTNFGDANTFLRQSARSIDHDGYDKHDVWITWEDGFNYKGRWDVKRDGSDTSIGLHIEQWLEYVIRHLDDYTMKDRKEAQEFLDRYKLFK